MLYSIYNLFYGIFNLAPTIVQACAYNALLNLQLVLRSSSISHQLPYRPALRAGSNKQGVAGSTRRVVSSACWVHVLPQITEGLTSKHTAATADNQRERTLELRAKHEPGLDQDFARRLVQADSGSRAIRPVERGNKALLIALFPKKH